MIRFIECKEPGYAARTVVNARSADLTIAFAVDFKTAGEILTHKAAYGKYHAVEIQGLLNNPDYSAEAIAKKMLIKNLYNLNIAGNGIYSLKEIGDQPFIDKLIRDFISLLKLKVDRKFSIRSGGQTGVDEAALKAGDKLGLDCTCLAPKNWLFRGVDGKDIMHDPDAFCARFGEQYVNNI